MVLVEVGLDPLHLGVAQRSVLAVTIALAANVIRVQAALLDRGRYLPAGQGGRHAGETGRVRVAVPGQTLASGHFGSNRVARGFVKQATVLGIVVASVIRDRLELSGC